MISLPALGVGWVGIADELGADEGAAERLWIVAKLAAVDIGSWVLPLVALALAAPRAGIGARFVPYVVASNWASAIICWMMVPPALLRLVLPGQTDLASLLSLALFLFSMVLTWRMTSTVMARGAVVGTAVFAGMFVVSLACLLGIQTLLGIPSPL